MLTPRVCNLRSLLGLALMLSGVGLAFQAQALELQDLQQEHDSCYPKSIGRPFKDALHNANFIWFADGQNCKDSQLNWITHIVHNHSKLDLIFKWPKGEIWADKFNALPKEYSRGEPVPVISVNPKPDPDAPIWYTQSYLQKAPAAVYTKSTKDKEAVPAKEFRTKATTDKLVTKIRTAARTKDGIVKVLVDFTSALDPEKKLIQIRIRALPKNVTVAVTGIPYYLDKLEPNKQKETIGLLGRLLKEQNSYFTISSLRKLVGKRRSDYVPKRMVDRLYLAIHNAGGKNATQFSLPISEGAKREFDPKRFVTELASLVVLNTNGAVLGNGRVSFWLPAPRR